MYVKIYYLFFGFYAMHEKLSDLNKIIALMPGNVFWKDRNGIYQGCNDNCVKVTKINSREEIVGKTIFDLMDYNYAEKIHLVDEQIMQDKREKVFEEVGPDMHGKPAIYLTRKIPLMDDDGNVIGLLGVSMDITAQKNVETELKYLKEEAEKNSKLANTYLSNMIANLPETFYWMDKNGKILGCNDNQARLFGLHEASELIGKNGYDIAKIVGWPAETVDAFRKNDLEVMETRQTKRIEETAIINDEQRTFVSFKNPLIDNNNQVIGVFGVSVDITERKEAEEALVAEKQRAESANEAKSEFIRNMSHDLRTPFNGILGFSRYLEKIEQDPTKKEFLSYITQSCEKLLALVNEILTLTSLDTGEQSIKPIECNIKEIVDEIKLLMNAQIKNKHLEFFINYINQIPNIIIIDRTRVHRILLNLIANAIKFTEKGSITINVEITQPNNIENAATLIIEITDTGIGIPQDKYELIFERFSRLTIASQGKYEGTGLGLYIVKQMINELNGTIEVQSIVDQGSKFICKIPCVIKT